MYSGRGYVARKLVQTNDGDDDIVIGVDIDVMVLEVLERRQMWRWA